MMINHDTMMINQMLELLHSVALCWHGSGCRRSLKMPVVPRWRHSSDIDVQVVWPSNAPQPKMISLRSNTMHDERKGLQNTVWCFVWSCFDL